jgi:hypothetical protein
MPGAPFRDLIPVGVSNLCNREDSGRLTRTGVLGLALLGHYDFRQDPTDE